MRFEKKWLFKNNLFSENFFNSGENFAELFDAVVAVDANAADGALDLYYQYWGYWCSVELNYSMIDFSRNCFKIKNKILDKIATFFSNKISNKEYQNLKI